jgi:hypothetical protein
MKTIALIFALFTLTPLTTALRADSLGDMTTAAGLDWMVGKWVSEDGNVSFSYTWKLNKHALAVTFKMGDRETEGYIVVKPGTDKVIYGGADNEGGVTVGEWTELNDHPLLTTKHTDAEGKERKMAVEYIKVDNDHLTVKLYAVGDDGQLDTSKSQEVGFKRGN